MPVSQGYFFMSTFKKFFSLYLNILNMIYNSFLHVIRALNVVTYVTFKAGQTQQ